MQDGVGVNWSQYRLQTTAGTADAFIAHDDQLKPVVFLLQGSGCIPLFTVEPDGRYRPTIVFQDVIVPDSERVHFAMVEQRGVAALRFSVGMSQEQKSDAFERVGRECSDEFLRNKTKQVRVEQVSATIRAVAAEPWAGPIILAGHSEGTHVATGVLQAERSAEIAAAGLFASAGPTPFWAGYVAAGAEREAFEDVFDRIRMLQNAEDDFMFQGLPARRWKTFWLETTPLDDVRDSTVPLFVAHGTRDVGVLASDLFALEAIRQQPDRPFRYVVLEDGDHAFATPDGRSLIVELFNDFLRWALDPDRLTGVAVQR